MKKISITTLLIVLLTSAAHAQSLYSEKNLNQSSKEDLNLYLAKARQQKKTGGVLLIASPISFATGLILSSLAWSGGSEMEYKVGLGFVFVSMGALAVGIPLRITGSRRVKKVLKVYNAKYETACLNIAPFSSYDYQTNSVQSGISLRVRF